SSACSSQREAQHGVGREIVDHVNAQLEEGLRPAEPAFGRADAAATARQRFERARAQRSSELYCAQSQGACQASDTEFGLDEAAAERVDALALALEAGQAAVQSLVVNLGDRQRGAQFQPTHHAPAGLERNHAARLVAALLHARDELLAALFPMVGEPVLPGVLVALKVQVATEAVVVRALEQLGERERVLGCERHDTGLCGGSCGVRHGSGACQRAAPAACSWAAATANRVSS